MDYKQLNPVLVKCDEGRKKALRPLSSCSLFVDITNGRNKDYPYEEILRPSLIIPLYYTLKDPAHKQGHKILNWDQNMVTIVL